MNDGYRRPADTIYSKLISRVMEDGAYVESRFGDTIELLGVRWVGPADRYPLRKGMNRSIGYMELAQIFAGIFDNEQIMRVAPKAAGNLFTKEMAYGPRIGDGQIPVLIEALKANPSTRQAILFYAKPEDGPTNSNPCTTTAQFLIRGGALHLMVNMRSWDLIKGLPYDVTCLCGLQQAVARVLDLPTGFLSVWANSGHIYLKDIEAGKLPLGESQTFELEDFLRTWSSFRIAGANATYDEWNGKFPPFVREGERVAEDA